MEDLNLFHLMKDFKKSKPLIETKKIILDKEATIRINEYLTKKVNESYDEYNIKAKIERIIDDRDAHLEVYEKDGIKLNVMWIDSNRYQFNEVLIANSDYTKFALDLNLHK